jgi:hypothetical protein
MKWGMRRRAVGRAGDRGRSYVVGKIEGVCKNDEMGRNVMIPIFFLEKHHKILLMLIEFRFVFSKQK